MGGLLLVNSSIVHRGTECHLFHLSFITAQQHFAFSEYRVSTTDKDLKTESHSSVSTINIFPSSVCNEAFTTYCHLNLKNNK